LDWKRYCSDTNRVTEGNRIVLLDAGQRTFDRMIEAIDEAERFVSLATFIFAADDTGKRFRESLIRASERGVDVRVIIDGVGSIDTPRSFFEPLIRAGAQIHTYHPVSLWRLRFVIWHRMHRKNLVVDGSKGFCGGLNVHDAPLLSEQGGKGWHDIHAQIEGPAVRDLHRSFLNTWIRVRGQPSGFETLLPHPEPVGDHSVAIVSAGGKKKGKRRRMIQREYWHAISRARRSIHLWNAYFIPGRGIRRLLRNACARGVDVRVILPERGNHPAVQFASEYLYAKLMRYGVKLLRWPGAMMHAKGAVIDSVWSTVGSYNMDAQSHLHNLELTVTVYSESFGSALETMFERDLRKCHEVDPEQWGYRPLADRVLQFFCHQFRNWL
jgi:cardiolipin synthase